MSIPKIDVCKTIALSWNNIAHIINTSKNHNGELMEYQKRLDDLNDAYIKNKCKEPLTKIKGYLPF